MAKAAVVPLVQPPVPTQQVGGVWPIAGDAPDLEIIIADQWHTIAAQAALIDAYQTNLNSAQNPAPPPPSTGSGTAVNTKTLALVGTSGSPIQNGASIAGTGVPTTPAPKILGQISGTAGGDGSYLLDTVINISAVVLSISSPAAATTWPTPSDAPTLELIRQAQTGILRMQSSLLQQYMDLLNVSVTAPPATGP